MIYELNWIVLHDTTWHNMLSAAKL